MYGFIRFRKDKEVNIYRKLLSCVYVCYIAGLICLVVGFDLIGIFWYELFYHTDSGVEISWFSVNLTSYLIFLNILEEKTLVTS